HRREIRATPWSAVTIPRMGRLWAVVASKYDNRVLFDAYFLDRVQNLSSTVVHLGQTIGPIAIARFAGELRIWQRRKMEQRERNVCIERFARVRVALDKIHSATRDLGFHSSAAIDVQLRNLQGLLTLMRFVDVFGANDVRVPALLVAKRRPHA